MILPQAACKYWDVTVSAVLATGGVATIAGVDFTLVPIGSGSPDANAVWLPSTYLNGVATILVAGPQFPSPPVGALVCSPLGAAMWGRVTDSPERDIALVDLIRLV